MRSKEKITLKASLKDYAHSAFRVFRNAERQQGTTAWAAPKAFGAGKLSLLDSGFDTQRIGMLRHDAK
jgi:hypothetical protein